jgi:hypothetical protein
LTKPPERPTPPTREPQAGQGPWIDENTGRWWVVADDAAAAMRVFVSCDADTGYFGVEFRLQRVNIRWVPIDDFDDENEIEETRYSDDPGAVEAWRLTVVDGFARSTTLPD